MINRDTLQELLPPHTILEVDQDKTFISVGMHGGIITVNPLELPNDTFGQHHVNALAMGAIGLRIQDMAKITPTSERTIKRRCKETADMLDCQYRGNIIAPMLGAAFEKGILRVTKETTDPCTAANERVYESLQLLSEGHSMSQVKAEIPTVTNDLYRFRVQRELESTAAAITFCHAVGALPFTHS